MIFPGTTERLDRYVDQTMGDNIKHPPGTKANPAVDHPDHYTEVVPGIECIEVTRHFGFLRGNAIKYLWRADRKGNKRQDLEKAMWYIQKELDSL